MKQLKILICDPSILQDAPAHLLRNGVIELPLPPDFDLNLSKTVSELNEFGKLTQNAALPFSVGYSPEWNYIFECTVNTNTVETRSKLIPVEVWVGDKLLEYDALCLDTVNDESCTYEVSIENTKNNISTLLNECKLCDLDFGAFEWTTSNLEDNWQTDEYIDNGTEFVFPLVDWGGIDTTNGWDVDSFRPFFFKLAMAQKLFCKIGYTFKSPIFESAWGRRQIAYLGGDLNKLYADINFQFEVGLNGDTTIGLHNVLSLTAAMPYTNESEPFFDSGTSGQGYYDGTTINRRATNLCGKYHFCIEYTVLNFGIQQAYDVVFIKNGTVISTVSENTDIGSLKKLCSPIVDMVRSDEFKILFLTQGNNIGNMTLSANSIFYNEPVKPRLICDGDTLPLSSFLSCDITGKDFFEGMIHDINGKLEIDNLTKTVTLLPPNNVDFFGENYEGYFTKEYVPLEVKPNSKVVTTNCQTTNRYCLLGYKESSDKYIEEQPGSSNLFGTTTDLGAEYLNETTEKRNPLFEPTAERKFTFEPLSNNSLGIYIPVMWDNEDGEERSIDISPRQLTWHGYIFQDTPDRDASTGFRSWRYEGNPRVQVPYASQCPTTTVNGGQQLLFYNVYAGKPESFYEKFYKSELDQTITLSFLAQISFEQFCCIDVFRKAYCVNYRGTESIFRMVMILDKLTSSNQHVQVELVLDSKC